MATYQWLRCNAAGTACVPIPGATGASYTLTAADAGSTVTVQASDGSTAVQASPTTLVATAPAASGGIFRTPASVTTATAPKTSYSHGDLEALWVAAGGDPLQANTAAAIAEAESGGCLYAKHGPTDDRPAKICSYVFSNGENSYGLWQINRQAHPQYSAASLYTATGNAAAAVAIYRGRGNFSDWTTFTSGAYNQYLVGVPGGGPPSIDLGGAPTGALTPDVFKGYRDLRNSLGHHLPTQLERSRRTGIVALRMLAHRHKVRR